MKKKLVASILSAAMVGTLLVGCGSSATTEEAAPAEETTEEAAEEEVEEAEEEAEEATEEATEETASADATGDAMVLNMDDMMAGTQFEGLEAAEAYNIQIIVKAFQNTYWQAVISGVNDAADDLGVTVDSQGPNNESDIADQVNMLNSAINNNPAGIGLSACDASAVVDCLNSAKDAGVPIVAFDTAILDAPEGTLTATVATDSIAAGKVAATHAWDALKDTVAAADGTVRFGMVAQDATSTNHQQRGLGFVDGIIELATADGYDVAVTGNDYFVGACSDKGDEASAKVIIECAVPAQSTLDLAATEASAIMNEEDTICIYGTGQTAAEGIVQANDNLGVLATDPADGILGIGFDAGTILKEKISDGTLFGNITQMPYAMGYYTVCALVAKANGDDVEDMNIPGYWYDSTNMDDELIAPNLYD